MITVDSAMHTLYSQLCTQPYRASAHYTITDYSNDPLLTSTARPFILDPTLNTSVLTRGPAAKVYTTVGNIPK